MGIRIHPGSKENGGRRDCLTRRWRAVTLPGQGEPPRVWHQLYAPTLSRCLILDLARIGDPLGGIKDFE